MRIISKFKDYYDCIQSYGYDPKIVYNRETEKLDKKIVDKLTNLIYDKETLYWNKLPECFNSEDYPFEYYPFYIIVAGKIHIGYYLITINKDFSKKVVIEYDMKNVESFINSCSVYLSNRSKRWNRYSHRKPQLVSEWERISKLDLTTICIELHTPLILIDATKVSKYRSEGIGVKDPFLKKYKFAKCIDTFQMYQTLSMFVGNFLIEPSKKVWPISDVLKAETHGFDKRSFRKRK